MFQSLFNSGFVLLTVSHRLLFKGLAITCKPPEHISQGKYLLMALLSEMSLE